MYKIDKKSSGYLLTFAGEIKVDEMQRWYNDSALALTNSLSEFGVIVDMRTLKPLDNEAQQKMVAGQKLYKDKGMKRSAVILNDPDTTKQFKQLAVVSGIYAFERYIDASTNPNWASIAKSWVVHAIDPDRSTN